MKEKKVMTTRRIEMERFSLISSKPFQAALAALGAAVGHPDMAEFAKAVKGARTFADLEDAEAAGSGGRLQKEKRIWNSMRRLLATLPTPPPGPPPKPPPKPELMPVG
jgi:hypothetical protein